MNPDLQRLLLTSAYLRAARQALEACYAEIRGVREKIREAADALDERLAAFELDAIRQESSPSISAGFALLDAFDKELGDLPLGPERDKRTVEVATEYLDRSEAPAEKRFWKKIIEGVRR
jgi:hypothetical protein